MITVSNKTPWPHRVSSGWSKQRSYQITVIIKSCYQFNAANELMPINDALQIVDNDENGIYETMPYKQFNECYCIGPVKQDLNLYWPDGSCWKKQASKRANFAALPLQKRLSRLKVKSTIGLFEAPQFLETGHYQMGPTDQWIERLFQSGMFIEYGDIVLPYPHPSFQCITDDNQHAFYLNNDTLIIDCEKQQLQLLWRVGLPYDLQKPTNGHFNLIQG